MDNYVNRNGLDYIHVSDLYLEDLSDEEYDDVIHNMCDSDGYLLHSQVEELIEKYPLIPDDYEAVEDIPEQVEYVDLSGLSMRHFDEVKELADEDGYLTRDDLDIISVMYHKDIGFNESTATFFGREGIVGKWYGTPRHSGRYPWGSGKDPYQHGEAFLKYVRDCKRKGYSDKDIRDSLNMSSTEYRQRNSIAVSEKRASDIRQAQKMHDKKMSNVAIAQRMGVPESTIRNYLKATTEERNNKTSNVAQLLQDQVTKKGVIDIGKNSELEVHAARTTFDTAVKMMEDKGYKVYKYDIEQLTNPGKYTTIKVLADPKYDRKEIRDNLDLVQPMSEYFVGNDTKTRYGIEYPKSIDSSRIKIVYNEEGGAKKDGVIELRRGVEDISLGNSSYAQVRIAVDGTHYLKGMAMYKDDMPDGVDILYNSNKHLGTDKYKVFKKMKKVNEDFVDKVDKQRKDGVSDKDIAEDLGLTVAQLKDKYNTASQIDPDNPFGAAIKAGKKSEDGTIKNGGQRHYIDENGKSQLAVINKVKEEGDWNEYSSTIASQFLSKQKPDLIERQLKLSYETKYDQYAEIMALDNPTVRSKLLRSFADGCDSSAVDLKAAALPGQEWKVILPITTLKDNEIYAPTFHDGDQVALVRYPHGGIFEIPVLTVNNKHKDAKSILANAKDAVGINASVAEQLSGADFDGDTVLVIPTNKNGVKISARGRLQELIGFDTKEAYPGYEGMKPITSKQKQREMGIVSNLITDMTLKGAPDDELVRAVKHSMVVIDSEKHNLNWRLSEKDNGIKELKAKWQVQDDGKSGGAATLISRAKNQRIIDKHSDSYDIDPVTGEKIFRKGKYDTYQKTLPDGTVVTKNRKMKSTQMAEAKDPHDLTSGPKGTPGTPAEELYADYAYKLKKLANQARLDILATPSIEYNKEANERYSKEVQSLEDKLTTAKKNSPKERIAQLRATMVVNAKLEDNPDISDGELKKIRAQALGKARADVGAGKKDVQIHITDKEWEAIQSGALHQSKLMDIFNNMDEDELKARAMPKNNNALSDSKIARIRSMNNAHYTIEQIAQQLGISTSTVSEYI